MILYFFVICVEVARGSDLCIKWSAPFNFAISYNLFSLFIHDFVFLWFVLRLQGALIFASNDQPPFNFAISYNLFSLFIHDFVIYVEVARGFDLCIKMISPFQFCHKLQFIYSNHSGFFKNTLYPLRRDWECINLTSFPITTQSFHTFIWFELIS